MDIFLLYLWTRLDSIQMVFIGLSMFGFGIVFHCLLEWVTAYRKEDKDTSKALLKRAAKYTLIPVMALVVIPSQKDTAIIAGGWAVKQIATSEGAQQLGSKTLAIINGRLDEELAKLSPKDKK